MATSVPVPMAMPRSAWASAGASLMPSPTMATTWPAACRSATRCGLVGGQHLGHHVVDADLCGDRVRGADVVAGDHPDLQAERLELGDGLGGGRA